MIIVLWRAGLRISEALGLAETDLDRQRGAVLVRAGKGGRRREVGMDRWAWSSLDPWLELRRTLPVGALFCVLRGPTRGRPCAPAAIRAQLHRTALAAGVRRRFAPHQLRHAHAVEMSREGIPLLVIQRQLGHYAGDRVKGEAVVRRVRVVGGARPRHRGVPLDRDGRVRSGADVSRDVSREGGLLEAVLRAWRWRVRSDGLSSACEREPGAGGGLSAAF